MNNTNNADALLAAAIATHGAPGLKISVDARFPERARVECAECRSWNNTDGTTGKVLPGEIVHSKHCDSKPQIPSVAAVFAERAARDRKSELARFAARVRRTGLTHGRDADVADCVRLGLLSASDAMNTDD